MQLAVGELSLIDLLCGLLENRVASSVRTGVVTKFNTNVD